MRAILIEGKFHGSMASRMPSGFMHKGSIALSRIEHRQFARLEQRLGIADIIFQNLG